MAFFSAVHKSLIRGRKGMESTLTQLNLPIKKLRSAIQKEYELVAREPGRGFHFHTGRPLAQMLGYEEGWLDNIPESAIESFAGTGNPFRIEELRSGENVIDIGSGAGLDSLIAARMVAPDGKVIGVDMTPAMLNKAQSAAKEIENVDFRHGIAESLPVEDGWADVVISNGVFNLVPDKPVALQEIARVLKPGGRLQIGDILVQKEVPQDSKRKIDLWTG
jgi:SAM-dependent methyltransferase